MIQNRKNLFGKSVRFVTRGDDNSKMLFVYSQVFFMDYFKIHPVVREHNFIIRYRVIYLFCIALSNITGFLRCDHFETTRAK